MGETAAANPTIPPACDALRSLARADGWCGGLLAHPTWRGSLAQLLPSTPEADWDDLLARLLADTRDPAATRLIARDGGVDRHECEVQACEGPRRVLATHFRRSSIPGDRQLFATARRPSAIFRGHLTLLAAGIATTPPIAWLEHRRRREGWLITLPVGGLLRLDYVIESHLPALNRQKLATVKHGLAKAVGDAWHRLAAAGMRLAMPHPGAFAVSHADAVGWQPRCWLLDPTALRRGWRFRSSRRDLDAFLQAIPASRLLTERDLARFLRSAFPPGDRFQPAAPTCRRVLKRLAPASLAAD